MHSVPVFPMAVVCGATFIAAVTDVWKFKIYNTLTVPLLVTGFVYQAFTLGAIGLIGSAMGVVFGFSALVIPYIMGGMGAGDVKLLASVGAWLGLPMTAYVLVASCLAAGVCALVLVVLTRCLPRLGLQPIGGTRTEPRSSDNHAGRATIEELVQRPDRRQRLVPFGAMIAVGTTAVFTWVSGLPTV